MTLSQRLRALFGGSAANPASSGWPADPASPWVADAGADAHACNICRWTGDEFIGGYHSEAAQCPQCGSIARDRFLFWCFVQRSEPSLGSRLLETSPRMGNDYRTAMGSWFDYLCSDYDESAHKGVARLDLQQIDRPDASFDIILTPHVLEHVPKATDALLEIHRVLGPGGRMYLQVPVLQGHTAPPTEPEFHGDNTPVFWRFGFDLTEQLRAAGFASRLLCTQEWLDLVRSGATEWPEGTAGEFDVASMLSGVVPTDLDVVADATESNRYGFLPAYMFLTWECVKPG